MTDHASTQQERLARLSARRHDDQPEMATAPPRRRRPAEASRWLVAAGAAAAGFGLVAGFAVASQPDVAVNSQPGATRSSAQSVGARPIIIINTGAPMTVDNAVEVLDSVGLGQPARTALIELPTEPPSQPSQTTTAPPAVTETRGS